MADKKANLKNGKKTQFKTGDEAAKINGRKGGLRSAEVRNLKGMLLKAMKNGGYEKMVGVAMREMELGNAKFWELIRDQIGERPIDNVAVTADINNPFKDLTTEELKKLVESE